MAHKYDQRLRCCIGATFAPDGEDYYTIEWCLIDHPWEFDAELEQALTANNPFREVKFVKAERYARRREE